MIRFTILAASALFLIGCDFGAEGRLTPSSPSSHLAPPTPVPPPIPPPISGEIPVGVNFSDVLDTGSKWYSVRAPSGGTLVATLRWDPSSSLLLALGIGGEWFYGSSPNWSPIIGRVPVSADETYRVGVEWANPWDYSLNVRSTPFVITITIE
jgi:hypothetical protein